MNILGIDAYHANASAALACEAGIALADIDHQAQGAHPLA